MGTAKIKFVQGANVGTPGQALFGAVGTPVVLHNDNDSGIAVWSFTVIDAPPGSSLPIGLAQQGGTATWTFTPDVTGGYLIQLVTTDGAGNVATDIRCFGVKQASGQFVPPFQGTSSSLNFSGGARGWSPHLENWFQFLAALWTGGNSNIPGVQIVRNVVAFGAKGDGAADDAPAINAAILACGEGDEVFFPKTTANVYQINSPLLVSGNALQLGIVLRGTSPAKDGELPSFQTTIRANFAAVASGAAGNISAIGADAHGVQVLTIAGLSGLTTAKVGDTIVLSGCHKTVLTADFTQPAVGGLRVVQVDDNRWMTNMSTGSAVQVGGGGMYYVTNVNVDGVHVTLQNTDAISNTAPGLNVGAGAFITPGLWGDAANSYPYTITSINVGAGTVTAVASHYDEMSGSLINVTEAGPFSWVIKPPMLKLYSRECEVRNLRFDGNNTCGPCIDSTVEVGGINNTSNKFRNLSFGRAVYGIKIGDTGPSGQFFGNCDNYVLHHISGNNLAHSLICAPNQTGQSKSHKLFDVTGLQMPYTVWVRFGSFSLYNGGCGGITCCHVCVIAPTEPITMKDQDCEDGARIYSSAAPQICSTEISGIRCDYSNPAKMAPDGAVVRYGGQNGGLLLHNSTFFGGESGGENIKILISGGSTQATVTATVMNCSFGRTDANVAWGLGGGEGAFLSIGNTISNGGLTTPVPTGVVRTKRIDLADATYIVPYSSAPWTMQAMNLEPERVAGYSWDLVNGVNNDLTAIPNTFAILETSSGLPSAAFTLTGIAGGKNGDVRIIKNRIGQQMTIANASASSAAGNRIYTATGANVACDAIVLIYLAGPTPAGWYEIAHSMSASTSALALVNGDNDSVATTDGADIVATGPTGAYALKGFATGVKGQRQRIKFNVNQALTIKNNSSAGVPVLTGTGADVVFPAPGGFVILDFWCDGTNWNVV